MLNLSVSLGKNVVFGGVKEKLVVQVSKIPSEVRNNPKLLEAVNQADGWIHELLNRWMENKSWEWNVKPDKTGEPLFDLRLSVDEGSASERFDRFEISNKRVVTDRVFQVWGQALDAAILQQRQLIAKLVRDVQEDGGVGH